MDSQAYLIFRLSDSQYGIEAALVREIFPLPELTSIPEVPPDIIGLLNLRGKIVPIMHLGCRLGQSHPVCHLSNAIILLEWQGLQVGMVVDQVQDVLTLTATHIDTNLEYGRSQAIPFMKGVTNHSEVPIVLLNPDTLIREPEQVVSLAWEAELTEEDDLEDEADLAAIHQHWEALLAEEEPTSTNLEDKPENTEWSLAAAPEVASRNQGSFFEQYCPTASEEDKAILHQRAVSLQFSLEEAETTDQHSLAVVGLGNQYFGLDLGLVREFINIRNVTPIPCCPHHIVGNINLRGEVMTLVDIQAALNLTDMPFLPPRKAVVFEVEDVVAGITVDEVIDVTSLSATHISPIPSALPANYREYLLGTTAYNNQYINILDLPKMISQGVLSVNQS